MEKVNEFNLFAFRNAKIKAVTSQHTVLSQQVRH